MEEGDPQQVEAVQTVPVEMMTLIRRAEAGEHWEGEALPQLCSAFASQGPFSLAALSVVDEGTIQAASWESQGGPWSPSNPSHTDPLNKIARFAGFRLSLMQPQSLKALRQSRIFRCVG